MIKKLLKRAGLVQYVQEPLKYENDLDAILKGEENFEQEEAKLAELKVQLSKAKNREITSNYLKAAAYNANGFAWLASGIAAGVTTFNMTAGRVPQGLAVIYGMLGGAASLALTAGISISLDKTIEKYFSSKINNCSNKSKDLSEEILQLEELLKPMPDIAYVLHQDKYTPAIEAEIRRSMVDKEELLVVYTVSNYKQSRIAKQLRSLAGSMTNEEKIGVYDYRDIAKIMGRLAKNRKPQVGIILIDDALALQQGFDSDISFVKMVFDPTQDKWARENLWLPEQMPMILGSSQPEMGLNEAQLNSSLGTEPFKYSGDSISTPKDGPRNKV